MVRRHDDRPRHLRHGTGRGRTADFAFDVPVRFDSDQMEVTIETYQLGSWRQIMLIEVRP